ncbi:MAG: flagellar biosynthesis anti-sigma factor FlgM [Nitrosomonadales bacterium]|nr:flagellar biosynthesis anti-sigma factor FlgM [Nitrosomonadales bacterium]
MKIEKSSKPLPATATPAGEGRVRAQATKTSDNTPSAAPSSTSVNLGATSTQLRSMESSVASAPLVNAAKIAEIKQAISEGRFQVNSGVVADSLIKSVNDLISVQNA